MKKEILSAIGIIAGILFGTTLSLSAQEKLSLKQCREMALKYNKEMAAADRQTEAARLMSLSYKANFFPNFTANGTGIYSTADGRPSSRPNWASPKRKRIWKSDLGTFCPEVWAAWPYRE